MENENEDVVIDLELNDELSESDVPEVEIESPDVELDELTIEKIRRAFDAGSTRSMIAKELGLDRADVIEVLSKYVGRNKINGKHSQEISFKFDATGKKRIELGDRLNTSIYVSVHATSAEIETKKTKWLKIINDKND